MNQIVSTDGDVLDKDRTGLTINGWVPGKGLTLEVWGNQFGLCSLLPETSRIAMGDMILYAENNFGDTYTDFCDMWNRPLSTLANYVSCAKHVPMEVRKFHLGLLYSHHLQVARIHMIKPLPVDWKSIQNRLLVNAADNRMTVRELALLVDKEVERLTPKDNRSKDERLRLNMETVMVNGEEPVTVDHALKSVMPSTDNVPERHKDNDWVAALVLYYSRVTDMSREQALRGLARSMLSHLRQEGLLDDDSRDG